MIDVLGLLCFLVLMMAMMPLLSDYMYPSQQATTPSFIDEYHDRMRIKISRMEQQRLDAQQEADRLQAQMANSTQYTQPKLDDMVQEFEKLRQIAEQSEKEIVELQKQLEH